MPAISQAPGPANQELVYLMKDNLALEVMLWEEEGQDRRQIFIWHQLYAKH